MSQWLRDLAYGNLVQVAESIETLHLLGKAHELDPEGLERLQGSQQVRYRPGEAIL
jgi:hypothetical protein